MTKALKGKLYGVDRKTILADAKTKTRVYFGIDCVAVKLENETPHPVMAGFNAEFTGVVWHDIEPKSYGPDVCRGCGRQSWPSSPLNPKTPEEWE